MKNLFVALKNLFKVNRVYIGYVEDAPMEWNGKAVLVYSNGWIVTE